jgi:hypothetical protein
MTEKLLPSKFKHSSGSCSGLLFSEGLVLYHEEFRTDALQELELPRLDEHGLCNCEVLFVIVLGDLVLDGTNSPVSY